MVAQVLTGHRGGFATPPLHLHKLGGADGSRIGLGDHHDPAGDRAGRVLERDAAQISRHRPGLESSIDRTVEP